MTELCGSSQAGLHASGRQTQCTLPEEPLLRANSRKRAQACEALYRWDSSFPLGKPLAKLSAGTVVEKLRSYASIHGLYDHTTFCSTVTSVSFSAPADR